tara:strand:- start:117 stop:920 length:804 start_codon:yes stop_codon:yes gene_type:complete
MKSSPFKQAETGDTNAADKALRKSKNAQYIVGPNGELSARSTETVVTPAEDTFVEGTPDVVTKKPYVGAANDACSAQYIAANGNAACDEYKGLSQKVKDEANTTTVKGTPDKTVKGKDTETEVPSDKKIYRKVEGRASSAYATRNNLRKAKVAARNAKKYQRKQDKADRRSDPDKYDAKKQRRARKETASQAIKKVADSEMLNATTQSAQGQSAFDTSQKTRLKDVEDSAGSLTRDEQKNAGKGVAKMKNPGFFKKKSPMKMNYFKK